MTSTNSEQAPGDRQWIIACPLGETLRGLPFLKSLISKRKSFQKGSLLIASVGVLSIFSITIMSLAFQGAQHSLLGKREREQFESKADFLSAIHWVHQRILSDTEEHEDSPLDFWYGRLTAPSPWSNRFTVEVSDEEAKLNLNTVSEGLLRGFLKKFEKEIEAFKGDKKDLAKQILKRRSKDRIKAYEELFLLEKVEPEDLEKLRPYLTVYPASEVLNLNTADPLVLESLVQSFSGDDFAKRELYKKILQYRTLNAEEKIFFRNEDLNPSAFLRVLSVRETVQMLQLTQQLLPKITTDSETFRAVLKHFSGAAAETVFKTNKNTGGLEILSWHER